MKSKLGIIFLAAWLLIGCTVSLESGSFADADTAGISLEYDTDLINKVIAQRVAAAAASPAYGHAPAAFGPKPERIIITLQGDKFPESTYQPQIIISAEPFAAIELLNGEMVSVGEQAVTFQNGAGSRWLAQETGQAATPVNNSDLVYLFNGKTDDERYFVYALIPVSHPDLPNNENEVTNYEALLTNWSGYIDGMQSMLNNQSATAFVPDLTAVDALLSSLLVDPNTPLATLIDRGFVDAPRLTQQWDAVQITPAVLVDYWEIHNDAGEDGSRIVAQSGNKAALATAVSTQLDALTGPEWCGETTPPSCLIYIVSATGSDVRTWMGNTGIGEFLGTIDSPEEAVLLAAAYDYGVSQSSIGNSIRATENGYELTGLQMVKYCAPIQTDWFILQISTDGDLVPYLHALWSRFGGCI